MQRALLSSIGLSAVCVCLWAQSAGKSLPEGPGKPLTEKVCTACHDVDTAVSGRHDRAGWKKVIDDMVSRGADGTAEELNTIGEYLTKYFGPKADGSK
jgi:cytochrome c5